jgi:regulatory protein
LLLFAPESEASMIADNDTPDGEPAAQATPPNAKTASELARMRGKAIKLLAGREFSEQELLKKLAYAQVRSAQMSERKAKHKNTSTRKAADDALQISRDNGFDEPEGAEPDGLFSSKSFDLKQAKTAPQVFLSESHHANPHATPQGRVRKSDQELPPPEERVSAREQKIPAAQNAAAVLKSLKADGYQSDTRYAQSMTRHLAGRMSKSAIASKLKYAGIDKDAIEDAMASEMSDEQGDDFTVAQGIWAGKFRQPPRDDKEKAKQVRFLQSRGFSISISLRVLRDAGAAVDEKDNE